MLRPISILESMSYHDEVVTLVLQGQGQSQKQRSLGLLKVMVNYVTSENEDLGIYKTKQIHLAYISLHIPGGKLCM